MFPKCDCKESNNGKFFDGLEDLAYIEWVEGKGVDFNTFKYCPWCGKELKPVIEESDNNGEII